MSRLLLGSAPVGRAIARQDTASVMAITDDQAGEEQLREMGITVYGGDPTDAQTLKAFDEPIRGVIIATDADRTLSVTEAATAVFAVPIHVHRPPGIDQDARDRVETLADAVIDGPPVTGSFIADFVTNEAGGILRKLLATIRNVDGELAVLAHSNPDPDAIASAIGLATVAKQHGVQATPCYFGEISHQENRALVNVLDLDLCELEDPADVESFDGIALVDHARPAVNNDLPEGTPIDIVVDHHPPRGPVDGAFVDLRSDVGATSTIILEYIDRIGMDLDPSLATALLFGIRTDTDDFTRQTSTVDFTAASTLIPIADLSLIERIESPSIDADTFGVIADAIENRRTHGTILTAGVGYISSRDAIAQAADRLLDLEGIRTTLVFGIHDDVVHASCRARGADIDLGETVRRAFDSIGSAGGHADMAAAQIPLGILTEETDEVETAIDEVVTGAFLDAVSEPAIRSSPEGVDTESLSFLTKRGN